MSYGIKADCQITNKKFGALKQFVCILFFMVPIIGCADVNDKRDFFYNKGCELFLKQEYIKAETYFKNALRIDPNFGLAYKRFGECEIKQNQIENAISLFQRAIQLTPNSWESCLYLAELYLLTNQYDAANQVISIIKNNFVLSEIDETRFHKIHQELEASKPGFSKNQSKDIEISPSPNDHLQQNKRTLNPSDAVFKVVSIKVEPGDSEVFEEPLNSSVVPNQTFSGTWSVIMIIMGSFMFVLILFNRRRI